MSDLTNSSIHDILFLFILVKEGNVNDMAYTEETIKLPTPVEAKKRRKKTLEELLDQIMLDYLHFFLTVLMICFITGLLVYTLGVFSAALVVILAAFKNNLIVGVFLTCTALVIFFIGFLTKSQLDTQEYTWYDEE